MDPPSLEQTDNDKKKNVIASNSPFAAVVEEEDEEPTLKRRGVDADEDVSATMIGRNRGTVPSSSAAALYSKRQKKLPVTDTWEQDYPHYDDEDDDKEWNRSKRAINIPQQEQQEEIPTRMQWDVPRRPAGVATRQRLRPHVVQLARGDHPEDEEKEETSSQRQLQQLQQQQRRRRIVVQPVVQPQPPAAAERHQRYILDLPTWMKPTLQWKTILFALAVTACVSVAIFATVISTSSNDNSHVDSQQLSSSQNSINIPEEDLDLEAPATITTSERTTVLPQMLDTFFADVEEPYNPNTHMPVLFQLRKSVDSTMLMEHFGTCIGWIQATNVGRKYASESLETLRTKFGTYVNVDLSKPEGIKHAHDLYLLYQPPSKLRVDGIATPLLHEVANKLLDASINRGKIYMMIPNPQDYIYSIYAFLQSGAWMSKVETVTNPNPYATMSFQDYCKENRPEFNLLAKSLTGNFDEALTFADLEIAKQLLRQKVLVGLVENRETSLARFQSHFGASLLQPTTPECARAPLNWPPATTTFQNSIPPSDLEQGIQNCCQLDLALYHYAKQLFIDQEMLYPTSI